MPNGKLIDAFKIEREGEAAKFDKKIGNRQLLWHGSRFSNFAGILSQGLRIAPPEAPSTGYLFGKGVYFADLAQKSAPYCCGYLSNGVILLLLCEVALGKTHNVPNPTFSDKIPKGTHSTWGMGRQKPDPKSHKTIDGIKVPIGKPI